MRIWFNHWFSTAYHLINLTKDQEENYCIIGSSANPQAIYKLVCDEWYSEPDGLSDSQYVEFSLDFCKTHHVDLFIPRRHQIAIAKETDKFSEIGVKILAVTDPEIIDYFDDKLKFYEWTKTFLPECIPDYRVAYSFKEFEKSVEWFMNIGIRCCYKLPVDEGAATFRVIDEMDEYPKSLNTKPGYKVTKSLALKVMSKYSFKMPVMVMPFLNGNEVSVDCLLTESGEIIIPRIKGNKRYTLIDLDSETVDLSKILLNKINSRVPVNIQFKYENNKPYLLEINPRMSGGLQLACVATKINIPNIAVNQLYGINKEWSYPQKRIFKVANLETPVELG